MLRRSFALLGDAAKATVKAIDSVIVKGVVKIVEDGSGVFDQKGNRKSDR
jgi:hypothetical protein